MIIDFDRFTHDKINKLLIAECSDFNGYHNNLNVRSPKTGDLAMFRASTVEMDEEGDVICWNLVTDHPKLKEYKMVIFND
jgi:hypothetical protein